MYFPSNQKPYGDDLMWTCPKCGREFKRTGQSHYCGEAPKTIEEYILQQEPSQQSELWQLHQTISGSLPDVKQRIAWSMPTYGEKSIVIQFFAHKNHISLYVGEKAIAHFQDELQEYEYNKSAIYLKYNRPIPEMLIASIVRYCYENE